MGQEERMIIRMAVNPRVLTYLDSPRVQRSVALLLLIRSKIIARVWNSRFSQVCLWTGLSPGCNESAGKTKSTKTRHGNPYIKSILCEVAWTVTRKNDSTYNNHMFINNVFFIVYFRHYKYSWSVMGKNNYANSSIRFNGS